MTAISDIPLRTIRGEETSLAAFGGQVLLIVNVASKCGLTPQYEGLEKLHERYREQGFAVLGFPANDFAGQEPGTDAEIAEFCTTTFGVQFPMFSKISVVGGDKHPLYQQLTAAIAEAEGDKATHREKLKGYGLPATEDPEVLWNFEKFLVSRTGEVVGRFAPSLTPDDDRLTAAVEREVATPR
ncbi:glutathione peroxidase [Cryptosporangium arvum]|uniref:glutathione peroxidase n=1 Tax=Cryptosporangium arvum TaxID=80871 RepID=UPI0004AE7FC3|nr:glutathione peroxidase [Cryptosporangium arvum]